MHEEGKQDNGTKDRKETDVDFGSGNVPAETPVDGHCSSST